MTEHALIQTLRKNFDPKAALLSQADAAVLMPIIQGSEPALLMTRRALHMNSHAGEVAFPGGRFEITDCP